MVFSWAQAGRKGSVHTPLEGSAPLAGDQVPFAEKARREAEICTWVVGMITEAHQAEAIVASDQADTVALARAVMDDPRWAWHAARALGAEAPYWRMYVRCHPSRWPGPLAPPRAAE